jgi:hypothetical protein
MVSSVGTLLHDTVCKGERAKYLVDHYYTLSEHPYRYAEEVD